jgi:hypothetical protein
LGIGVVTPAAAFSSAMNAADHFREESVGERALRFSQRGMLLK